MKYITSIIIIALLLYGSWNGFQLSQLQQVQKTEKEHQAEINQINYGLFNLQLWKEKAMGIFKGKMTDFDVDPSVYKEVEMELRAYLNDIYNDYLGNGRIINQFVDQAVKDGKLNEMFAKLIKQNIGPAIQNLNIKQQLPAIAKELTQELKTREPELKGHLTAGFKGILNENIKDDYRDPRVNIYKAYDQQSLKLTNDHLSQSIADRAPVIQEKIYHSYIPLALAAVLSILLYGVLGGVISISLTTAASILLLVLGVTMPMINIDARLNAFTMHVLDNEVSFDEQFIYYQSKSILDVTRTMIEQDKWDLKLVGILVLCFSVIIPLIKLILSILSVTIDRIGRSRWVKNIVYHLGKWSMADVFVVAMFMAYIGFQGILANQLDMIERNRSGFAVETLNYSELAPGALYFTTYCILSIITGIMIKRYHDRKDIV